MTLARLRFAVSPLALALAALVGPCAAAPPQSAPAPPTEVWRVPAFGRVSIYRGPSTPTEVVLFLSGDGGWTRGVVEMAGRLRDAGALVVGIDTPTFVKTLQRSHGCAYPAGQLEELSRAVQLHEKLPAYSRPILIGYSSGATLAYAAIAAAPPETFAGAISLGFCPDIELRAPLCRMRGLVATKRPKGVGYDLAPYADSKVPWMVMHGEDDRVCSLDGTRRFVEATGAARLFSIPGAGHGFGVRAHWEHPLLEAIRAIGETRARAAIPHAAAPEVADLSLVEVPAARGPTRNDFAVLLTGDGGWADIDKSIATGLADAGVPVVGWSSLQYYWTPRTPERAAADLARIVEHYASTWNKDRVRVIGYSFGADVASFLVNRLPSGTRARVAAVTLLSPSVAAAFEFHLASWLGGGADPRYPTLPEIRRVSAPLTCVHASDEGDSVCRQLRAGARAAVVGRGHHFSGDYAGLVQIILK